ncbi:uncharacterized protein LOC121379857 [Gigantopelta aegis]|uniref:uncharacterized protein LOC121379857 n=1 Tax=Gigantopelta aegis TaxID=1735272 RepID=UPI001B88989C|nr:uncharacterized protein LOC121379857 [Gigantopelta aegis]
MEPMNMDGTARRSKYKLLPRCPGLMVVLNTALILIATILIIVILHRVSQDKQNLPQERSQSSYNLDERFPGYFRTAEEQGMIERLMRQETSLPESVHTSPSNATCPFQYRYPNSTSFEPSLAIIKITHHGCCKSGTGRVRIDVCDRNTLRQETSLPESVHTSSSNATCAFQCRYPNNTSFEPILPIPKATYNGCCKTVIKGCSICVCHQAIRYAHGVYVENGAHPRVTWFPIHGCCKCINRV